MSKLIRALLFGGSVSLTILDTRGLVQKAIKIHSLDDASAYTLGGLLTCCAYCAAALKDESGSISLTVKAKDGDGAASVSGDYDLHIRGYIDGSCAENLTGGTVTVVREDGRSAPFVGTCQAPSNDLSDILSEYFQQSEQIPTAVKVDVKAQDGKCICAGGVIMQLLPGADEGAEAAAAEIFERLGDVSEKLLELGADGVFSEFFRADAQDVYELFPDYVCNCSEQKIMRVLSAIGRDELISIAKEQGAVSVHCHYCNKDYTYDIKQIEEKFGKY